MKSLIKLFFVFFILFFGEVKTQDERDWIWVGGSDIKDVVESVEEYRVPSPDYHPTGRQGGSCWVDSKGTFWFGYGLSTQMATQYNTMNDFWKFDGKNWTLMSPPIGTKRSDYAGAAGGLGTSTNETYPGSRWLSYTWIDKEDNLWLFGGAGYTVLGDFGHINDFWMFNGVNWTLLVDHTTWGRYGQKGVPSNTNFPGARSQGAHCTDKLGNFYLFGGFGYDATQGGFLADLWKFDGKMWTWLGGSDVTFDPSAGRYTNQTDLPIHRLGGTMWVDSKGDIWLYGGATTNATTDDLRLLSDTWMFNGVNWTKVSDNGWDFSSTDVNTPSSLLYASAWIDDNDIAYLFGGSLPFRDGTTVNQNTWKFDGTQWTLLTGNPFNPVQPGIYSSLGVSNGNSVPGSRYLAANCKAYNSRTFYMMGGYGVDKLNLVGFLNDVWTYSITDPVSTTTSSPITTTGSPPDSIGSSSSGSDNLPKIIGGSVGGAAALFIIIALIVFFLLRKRRNKFHNNDIELSGPADIHDVELHEKLGGGKFGEVYRGTWQGATVALKLLKNEERFKEFLSEVQILKGLNHPNVVRYIGIHAAHGGKRYIVTEYLSKGNLKDLLLVEKESIGVDDLLVMAKQVAAGMQYLEQKGVVHRDLAARNLLCAKGETDSYVVKVADFGLSRTTEGTDYYKSDDAEVPVKWSSPEVLEYGKSTSKSDVWSFGVVLWEIFSYGKVPYPTMSNKEVMEKVISGYRLECPHNCPGPVYDLMLTCWASNPDDRPNFAKLYSQLEVMTRVNKISKAQTGSTNADTNVNSYYGV